MSKRQIHSVLILSQRPTCDGKIHGGTYDCDIDSVTCLRCLKLLRKNPNLSNEARDGYDKMIYVIRQKRHIGKKTIHPMEYFS